MSHILIRLYETVIFSLLSFIYESKVLQMSNYYRMLSILQFLIHSNHFGGVYSFVNRGEYSLVFDGGADQIDIRNVLGLEEVFTRLLCEIFY